MRQLGLWLLFHRLCACGSDDMSERYYNERRRGNDARHVDHRLTGRPQELVRRSEDTYRHQYRHLYNMKERIPPVSPRCRQEGSVRSAPKEESELNRLRRRIKEVRKEAWLHDIGPEFLRGHMRFDHTLRCTACHIQASFEKGVSEALGEFGTRKILMIDDRAIAGTCNIRRALGQARKEAGGVLRRDKAMTITLSPTARLRPTVAITMHYTSTGASASTATYNHGCCYCAHNCDCDGDHAITCACTITVTVT